MKIQKRVPHEVLRISSSPFFYFVLRVHGKTNLHASNSTAYLNKELLNELYFFDFKYVCEGDLYCSRWHKPPVEEKQIL